MLVIGYRFMNMNAVTIRSNTCILSGFLEELAAWPLCFCTLRTNIHTKQPDRQQAGRVTAKRRYCFVQLMSRSILAAYDQKTALFVYSPEPSFPPKVKACPITPAKFKAVAHYIFQQNRVLHISQLTVALKHYPFQSFINPILLATVFSHTGHPTKTFISSVAIKGCHYLFHRFNLNKLTWL
jgi:hypothetical protein